MSIALANTIRKKKVGSPTTKNVLQFLAEIANDNGQDIWPSITTIKGATEFGRTAVNDALKKLKEDGILICVGKKNREYGLPTNRYRIDVDRLKKLPDARPKHKKPDWENRYEIAPDLPIHYDTGEKSGASLDREADVPQAASRTQSTLKTSNTNITKLKLLADAVGIPEINDSDIVTARQAYDTAALGCGWAQIRTDNGLAPKLAHCISLAGGLGGWLSALARAEKSDFLCGRIPEKPFKNNIIYLIKNFPKLLKGGFDNKAGGTSVTQPAAPMDKDLRTMAEILNDVSCEYGVESWKLRSKKFAPDFPDALNAAHDLMKRIGIAETKISAFLQLGAA